jgi:hypothetical protein
MPAQLDRRGTHIAKAVSQVRPGARPFDLSIFIGPPCDELNAKDRVRKTPMRGNTY